MKKVLLVMCLALAASGCAVRRIQLPDGSVIERREPMSQIGLIITFKNNCDPRLMIESMYGIEVRSLAYGRSATVPIPSRAFSGSSREIWAMASAYAGASDDSFIGSVELREHVNTNQGTRDKLWQVDRLDSPRGVRCPSPP